jgi:hypothetical protein
MTILFEPTRSFCYKFGRYTALAEIQSLPSVLSGEKFRLSSLAQEVIDKYLTVEQQQIKLKKQNSDKTDAIHSIIKFVVQLHVKNQSIFNRVGEGFYQARLDEEITEDALDEVALEEGDEEASEFEGWIYAFTFPTLEKNDSIFPIKIGKTLVSVEDRVAQQCKGSATFDNPKILGKWQVNRVGATELAIHNVLKARGRWRENIPSMEWFNTTIEEVEQIIQFVTVQ